MIGLIPSWARVLGIGVVLLGLGLWIESLRVTIADQALTIANDQKAQQTFRADAATLKLQHEKEMQKTMETYEANLKRQAAVIAAADDTARRLRSAIAIYAGVGQGLPAAEDSSLLRSKLSTLGQLYDALSADYAAAATSADAVNDRLAACEATVE